MSKFVGIISRVTATNVDYDLVGAFSDHNSNPKVDLLDLNDSLEYVIEDLRVF